MGLDHLLLREAFCGAAHDRVQPVQHMGALVVCKDQEVQRSRHLLLPQVQGLAAVGPQKRHLELQRICAVTLTLASFDHRTAKTAQVITWMATVLSLCVIYFFFFF